jgi:hypothetical protein
MIIGREDRRCSARRGEPPGAANLGFAPPGQAAGATMARRRYSLNSSSTDAAP